MNRRWIDVPPTCVVLHILDLIRVSEIESRRHLRSASTASLVVPRFQRKTLGGRAFPVAAAQTWNSLPSHVTSCSSLTSFKRCLKTELFQRSYVWACHRLMLHVTFCFFVLFLTLLRALEVCFDLRHVNHIRYYYYYYSYCTSFWTGISFQVARNVRFSISPSSTNRTCTGMRQLK